MSAQTDLHYQLDRAAGLTVDAACACRSAGALPLPAPHRRLLNAATRKLEGAQMALYNARHNPWRQPRQATPLQLELL